MGVNMRGILYSIIAALLVIPVIGLILFNSQLIEKNVDINIRSNELEYFSISIEEDLDRFLKIAGRRALISAVSKVITTGVPLVDAQANLTEMISNGTLDGAIAPLIDTNSLNLWKESVTNIANISGFRVDFQSTRINITQNDSYNVLFEANVFLNISDPHVKMGALKNLSIKTAIPIEGIEDPLFPLRTYGRVKRVIQTSNFSNFAKNLTTGTIASKYGSGNATFSLVGINGQKIFITSEMNDGDFALLNASGGIVSEGTHVPVGLYPPYIVDAVGASSSINESERIYLDSQTKMVWDLQNLTTFVKNKYYKTSVDGPSFLDRLEGRLNLSSKYKYGLETFVNLDELSSEELNVSYQYSCLDYLYWNNTPGSSIRSVGYDAIFSWLRIDSNHANIYGVNELI